ncbi:MAG: Lrp/AsnC family transcriptional regulator [Candidatus Woesearchaeota archaeon]
MKRTDTELIFLYSENARVKISDLASSLKKTSQRLKYSVFSLEKAGIVSNPHCVFDYSYFGLLLFRVYFKGGYVSEKEKSSIIDKLSSSSSVVSIYELTGEFDLCIEMESFNPSRFNKDLRFLVSLVPTLNNFKIVLNIVTHIYPRLYLIGRDIPEFSPEIIVGGDRAVESFSMPEFAVMRLLNENARIRINSLSRQSRISIPTVSSIIKNLKERRVIRAFKFVVNCSRLGIFKFRLFLKLHNHGIERESALMDFLRDTPEIVQVNKTVGDWDLEIDIESFDKSKIRMITVHLREQFADIIETFNIMEFFQYYRKGFLPGHIFEENK